MSPWYIIRPENRERTTAGFVNYNNIVTFKIKSLHRLPLLIVSIGDGLAGCFFFFFRFKSFARALAGKQ